MLSDPMWLLMLQIHVDVPEPTRYLPSLIRALMMFLPIPL
jgi:hypothetical protein